MMISVTQVKISMNHFTKIPIDITDWNLICPIIYEIPSDPCVLAENDGQVYSHAALRKWFKHKHTDPMTNLPSNKTMVLNRELHFLMSLIVCVDGKYFFMLPHNTYDVCYSMFNHDFYDGTVFIPTRKYMFGYSLLNLTFENIGSCIINKIKCSLNESLSKYFITQQVDKFSIAVDSCSLPKIITEEPILLKLCHELAKGDIPIRTILEKIDMSTYQVVHKIKPPYSGYELIVLGIIFTDTEFKHDEESNHFKSSYFMNCTFINCKFSNFYFCSDSKFVGCKFYNTNILFKNSLSCYTGDLYKMLKMYENDVSIF